MSEDAHQRERLARLARHTAEDQAQAARDAAEIAAMRARLDTPDAPKSSKPKPKKKGGG